MKQAMGHFVDWIDDRINPIVVRELRQTMRGRLIPSLLLVYIALHLFVVVLAYVDFDGRVNPTLGRDIFTLFYQIFVFAAILVIPAVFSSRLLNERGDNTMDLLYITTMPPKSIVTGKLAAGMVLTALFFFTALPFMAITYFLRGIDIFSVLRMALSAFLIGMFFLQVFMCLTLLPMAKWLRILVGLFVGWLGFAYYVAIFVSFAGTTTMIGYNAGWIELFQVFAITVPLTILANKPAVAMVEPQAADRARPVRLWYAAMAILSHLTLLIFFPTQQDLADLWIVAMISVVTVAMMVAISAPDTPSKRVLRGLPQNIAKRLPLIPFTSGSAPGLLWVLGMSLFTLFGMQLLDVKHSDKVGLSAVFLNLGAYALTALLLYNWFLSKFIKRNFVWVIMILVMIFLSGGGYILAMIAGSRSPNFERDAEFLLFNPFIAGNDSWRELAAAFWAVWFVLVLLGNIRRIIGQLRIYRPPEHEEPKETEA